MYTNTLEPRSELEIHYVGEASHHVRSRVDLVGGAYIFFCLVGCICTSVNHQKHDYNSKVKTPLHLCLANVKVFGWEKHSIEIQMSFL